MLVWVEQSPGIVLWYLFFFSECLWEQWEALLSFVTGFVQFISSERGVKGLALLYCLALVYGVMDCFVIVLISDHCGMVAAEVPSKAAAAALSTCFGGLLVEFLIIPFVLFHVVKWEGRHLFGAFLFPWG